MNYKLLFISNAYFQLSVAERFPELSFKCCFGVLKTYKHHHETLFIFTRFASCLDLGVFMSYLRYLFLHFHLHYDLLYNLMNTDTLVLFLIFKNISYYLPFTWTFK